MKNKRGTGFQASDFRLMLYAAAIDVMVERKELLRQTTLSGGAIRFVYQSGEATAKLTK